MNATTLQNEFPNTAPTVVDTAWYQWRGRAYAFPCLDGDGYMVYSADDGAFLCWSATAADCAVDASLAEMNRGEPLNR